jgi:GST-like protein
MYTLAGFKGAGSAAVEVALEATGAPYRLVDAASWEPTSNIAELGRLNPLKQVPALELPDGGILTESAAILIHLGLTFPQAAILPAAPAERDQCIRGLVYIAANCYSAISILDYPQRWCADADADEATLDRIRRGTRARLHRHWELFADLFPARPFLSGAVPGGLDFLAAVVSKWAGTRQHLQSARPDFHATLQRIDSHPRVAPVFARHWPA